MYHLKLERPKTLFRFFFYLAALPSLLFLIASVLFKFGLDKSYLAPVMVVLWFWLIPSAIVFPSLFTFSDFGTPSPVDWRSWVAAFMLYSVVAVGLWLLRGGRIKREKNP